MPLTIRFFAGAAEAAATDTMTLAETPGTLGELVRLLGAPHPRLARVLTVCTFLVDGRTADLDDTLSPGATVDVLPPFAGG